MHLDPLHAIGWVWTCWLACKCFGMLIFILLFRMKVWTAHKKLVLMGTDWLWQSTATTIESYKDGSLINLNVCNFFWRLLDSFSLSVFFVCVCVCLWILQEYLRVFFACVCPCVKPPSSRDNCRGRQQQQPTNKKISSVTRIRLTSLLLKLILLIIILVQLKQPQLSTTTI